MSERKVVLFVVEGKSDCIALELPLRRLFKDLGLSQYLRCEAYGTDPLLHRYREKDNPSFESADEVLDRIKECVDAYLASNASGIKADDIAGVAAVCDLDACFCRDSAVCHSDFPGIFYDVGQQFMFCSNIPYILKRNDVKRDAFGLLVSEGAIRAGKRRNPVPLGVFYMNLNLEHVLWNDVTCHTNEEKEEMAKIFRSKYKEDSTGFLSLLKSVNLTGSPKYLDANKEPFLRIHAFDRDSNLETVVDWVSTLIGK